MTSSESSPVVDGLRKVFADTYALYLKTQNYHWNVVGPHFSSLHALFESQYQELAEALDEVAEQLRILGVYAPGTFEEIQALTAIQSGLPDQSGEQMVGDLLAGNGQLVRQISHALAAASEAGDEGTVGLLSERLGSHQKAAWMLRSTLS